MKQMTSTCACPVSVSVLPAIPTSMTHNSCLRGGHDWREGKCIILRGISTACRGEYILPCLPWDKLLISNSGLYNEPEASELVSKRQLNQKRFSLTILNTLKHFSIITNKRPEKVAVWSHLLHVFQSQPIVWTLNDSTFPVRTYHQVAQRDMWRIFNMKVINLFTWREGKSTASQYELRNRPCTTVINTSEAHNAMKMSRLEDV